MKYFLLGGPLVLLVIHGSLYGFTFWHWVFIALPFAALIGAFSWAFGDEQDEGARVMALNKLIEHDQVTGATLSGMSTKEFNRPEVKAYRKSRDQQAAALLQDLNNKGGHTSR